MSPTYTYTFHAIIRKWLECEVIYNLPLCLISIGQNHLFCIITWLINMCPGIILLSYYYILFIAINIIFKEIKSD